MMAAGDGPRGLVVRLRADSRVVVLPSWDFGTVRSTRTRPHGRRTDVLDLTATPTLLIAFAAAVFVLLMLLNVVMDRD